MYSSTAVSYTHLDVYKRQVAVPAFAAEEVEQENGLTSSYVQMNIPYADFYKAAGVDNASEIDAVTSATKNKTRAGSLVEVGVGNVHLDVYKRQAGGDAGSV